MEISMDFKATRNPFATEIASASATRNDLGWFQGLRVPTIFFLRKRLASKLTPNFINIPK